jgi:hypothetical protein
MPTANPVPNESIADRVARRRREAAHSVLDQETGQLLEYRQLLKHPKFKEIWTRSAADEFGRLAQGIGGRIKGTDTIRFIHKREILTDRLKDVTYIKFVCNVRTEKKDPNFEQRHINARSQVCRRRSRQLLPHDSIEKTRIRKDKIVRYT